MRKLVAFAGLYVHGDLLDHCASLMLGVCEEAQGRGIGSTLMAILLATAKLRANLRKVQLTVFTDNTLAIRLPIAPSVSNSRACTDVFHAEATATSTPIRWPSSSIADRIAARNGRNAPAVPDFHGRGSGTRFSTGRPTPAPAV